MGRSLCNQSNYTEDSLCIMGRPPYDHCDHRKVVFMMLSKFLKQSTSTKNLVLRFNQKIVMNGALWQINGHSELNSVEEFVFLSLIVFTDD